MIFAKSIFDALSGIGLWGCIALAILCGAAIDFAQRVMRHKERMAKIQAGMNPDAKK